MGSTCCKNIRVAGIPQEDPVNVNNSEDEYYKRSIFSISPPIPSEFDDDKTTTQSTTTIHRPQHPNLNEENQTPVMFFPQERQVTNENNLENENKRITSSQFPPIRQQRFSKKPGIQRVSTPGLTVRLPKLHKSIDLENDDHMLESVSDDSQLENIGNFNDDWRSLTIPDGSEFRQDERFYTSTPIPPSPEESDSDEAHAVTMNYLLEPLSNNIVSDSANLSAPLSLLEILQLREQANLEKYFTPAPIPDLELLPQNLYSIPDRLNLPMIKVKDTNDSTMATNSFDDSTIYLSNPPVIANDKNTIANKIDVIYPEAFDEAFKVMRQQAIDNNSYRLIIEAWRPNSIEELIDQIKKFVTTKPIIDCLWIVYYWIARNIEYDTVPYVGKKHTDKSAEAVFRTRKAIGDGYANLFKRLCDGLDLICEKIHGYSKTYIFDPCNKSSVPIDHTWNAVQINQFWYLIDLTCSAGYLDDNQVFKRELNSYYFLSQPNEMIYHHFPAGEQWQLLKLPIKMAQYMQMPKLWPKFFQYDLQLINPSDTIHADLDPLQSYATVLIQAPRNISLIATFALNEKEIDGGQQITFDSRKRIYRCYFAPTSIGVHIIRFFAKNDSIENSSYSIVAELELDARQMPSKPISFPKTWKSFSELNLEILWPHDTHLIKMNHGDTHIEILIRAPSDVELVGRLTVDKTVKILGGHCTFLDRRNGVWRCLFAPNRDGLFEAFILAKRRLDPGGYNIAARFRIKAKRIPMPPLSYPKTWQLFHDLDLQVEIPRNSATVPWPEYGSYAQVCIRTPDDVRLISCIERNGFRVENGSLTQFNSEKQHWQMFFAPERTGQHKLLIFAHCSTPDGTISGIAVELYLNVTQLRHSIKFPVTYTTFLTKRCRIYEPIDGVLKRNTTVGIHCEIPDAKQVDLTIDSKWIKAEGYQDSILKRQILVGSKEVIIYAKYDEHTVYSELIKYTVQ